MVITIRLYRQHDLDLIGLYLEHGTKFTSLIRDSLLSYVRNDAFEILLPKEHEIDDKIQKIYRINMSLSKQHEDVINWISNIKLGYRNAIIKHIIRSYLIEPNVYIYMKNIIPIENNKDIKYNNIAQKKSNKDIVAKKNKTGKNISKIKDTVSNEKEAVKSFDINNAYNNDSNFDFFDQVDQMISSL